MTDTRHRVASVDDLDDGEMTEVKAGDLDLLLVRLDGDYYVTGAHCTHYGAPLADGVLEESTGCVVCPWHHAVFQVATGDSVEPPGRDCLNQFDVTVDDGEVYVDVPEGSEEHRRPDFCVRDESNDRHFVIVGGGAAGSAAVETLRRREFDGRISMVTADAHLPYDRPNLSKAYLAGEAEPGWLPLRGEAFYEDLDIEIFSGRRAEAVRIDDHAVRLDDGTELAYDKLLLATGGQPRRLQTEGAEREGVHLLRSRVDCEAIIDDIEGAERTVVVGSSFIGMESAASLTARGLDVTVASVEDEPFERVFGPRVGETFRELHEEHGVSFRLGSAVESLQGDGDVDQVVLEDGSRLDADLVVVGIGVTPATGFVEDLDKADDGSIEVDRGMRAAEDVYAAGDIARFPDPRTYRRVRIEHWRLANQHGEIAARNMIGEEAEYDEVPFFWTRQFGTSFKYVGHADRFEDVVIDGDLDERDYLAYYVDGDDVLAAVGTRGASLCRLHAMMRHGETPTTEQVLGGFDPL